MVRCGLPELHPSRTWMQLVPFGRCRSLTSFGIIASSANHYHSSRLIGGSSAHSQLFPELTPAHRRNTGRHRLCLLTQTLVNRLSGGSFLHIPVSADASHRQASAGAHSSIRRRRQVNRTL